MSQTRHGDATKLSQAQCAAAAQRGLFASDPESAHLGAGGARTPKAKRDSQRLVAEIPYWDPKKYGGSTFEIVDHSLKFVSLLLHPELPFLGDIHPLPAAISVKRHVACFK
jgi:hypothetical protein